jgi:hypothetical protein
MPVVAQPQQNDRYGYDIIINLETTLTVEEFCEQYYGRISEFMRYDMSITTGIRRLIWLLKETADTDRVGSIRVGMGNIGDTSVKAYIDAQRHIVFQINPDPDTLDSRMLTREQEKEYWRAQQATRAVRYSIAQRFADSLRSA